MMPREWRVHLRTRHNRTTARAMWEAGHDTYDIARALGVPEAAIYNYLDDVRVWTTSYERNVTGRRRAS